MDAEELWADVVGPSTNIDWNSFLDSNGDYLKHKKAFVKALRTASATDVLELMDEFDSMGIDDPEQYIMKHVDPLRWPLEMSTTSAAKAARNVLKGVYDFSDPLVVEFGLRLLEQHHASRSIGLLPIFTTNRLDQRRWTLFHDHEFVWPRVAIVQILATKIGAVSKLSVDVLRRVVEYL